jgi:hypothetical protein
VAEREGADRIAELELRIEPYGTGGLLPLPDLAFDARRYRAEIERATADQSWQTPDWQTADVTSVVRVAHEWMIWVPCQSACGESGT